MCKAAPANSWVMVRMWISEGMAQKPCPRYAPNTSLGGVKRLLYFGMACSACGDGLGVERGHGFRAIPSLDQAWWKRLWHGQY
ncbi:MAG: hypothetical protein ACKVTZ_00365 [Bacteroidia bacterium]